MCTWLGIRAARQLCICHTSVTEITDSLQEELIISLRCLADAGVSLYCIFFLLAELQLDRRAAWRQEVRQPWWRSLQILWLCGPQRDSCAANIYLKISLLGKMNNEGKQTHSAVIAHTAFNNHKQQEDTKLLLWCNVRILNPPYWYSCYTRLYAFTLRARSLLRATQNKWTDIK